MKSRAFLALRKRTVFRGIQTGNDKYATEGTCPWRLTSHGGVRFKTFTVILCTMRRQGKPKKELQKHLRNGKGEGKSYGFCFMKMIA